MALLIDPAMLDPETLQAIIESHITSGADMYKGDLKTDSEGVRKRLQSGELLLQYSEEFETVRIIAPD